MTRDNDVEIHLECVFDRITLHIDSRAYDLTIEQAEELREIIGDAVEHAKKYKPEDAK